MNTFLKHAIAGLFLIVSGFVFAQIPDTQHSEGIAFISGGVGDGESEAILAEAKQWPVLLELSQLENGRGVWIFGVQIKLINEQQKVIFNAQADGPYMLINLTPGDYQILATYQGVEQKRALAVKAGSSQKLNIFWK
ncbi:hypothetical protein DCO17_08075 [Polynucleobacter tropicus]|uniref:Carboxypeptidase regulatory-like domain-containing protein n=1 Tax=Polynucleobacter tropicus TaxID=1743174 RepID=A0A6M9PS23_9BURK|nr:carboxypeptidase-like regulatory domain-containing protein [Polynucleobacter tropicus]QKM65194.1 hypothetical protein DCO17_08075 [Polynucleobacter tropicus]